MKRFKEKISKFGSLVSLMALSVMFMLFIANLPEFMVSSTGRIFAVVWAGFALTISITHGVHLLEQRKQRQIAPHLLVGPKDARTRKNPRMIRGMRG